MTTMVNDQLSDQKINNKRATHSDTTCQTVCLTDPSNDQLVKDEGAQIFIAFDRRPSPLVLERIVKSLTMRLQRLEPMTGL